MPISTSWDLAQRKIIDEFAKKITVYVQDVFAVKNAKAFRGKNIKFTLPSTSRFYGGREEEEEDDESESETGSETGSETEDEEQERAEAAERRELRKQQKQRREKEALERQEKRDKAYLDIEIPVRKQRVAEEEEEDELRIVSFKMNPNSLYNYIHW